MFDNDLLHLVSYMAAAGAFLFILLSLASGLLYVAEVIEEHSAISKTVGQRTIYVIIVLLVGLHFVDSLPLHLTLLCIFSHLVYLQNFSRTWPSISLTSPAFIASCVLVIASHFVAFSHFSLRARGGSNSHGYNYGNGGGGTWGKQGRHGGWKNGRRLDEDSFMDVATFFGVCVWLVPFYLFLSLSANDNVLPSSGESPTPAAAASSHSTSSSSHSSILKSLLSTGFSFVPTLRRGPRGANQRDGLIALSAPSSPAPGAFGAQSRFPFDALSSPVGSNAPTYSPSGLSNYGSPGGTQGGQYANGSASGRMGGSGWGNTSPSFPPPSPSLYSPALGSPNSLSPQRVNQGNYTQVRPTLRLPIPTRRHTDIGAVHHSDDVSKGVEGMKGWGQYSESPMMGAVESFSETPSLNGVAYAASNTTGGPGLVKRKVG